MKKSAAFLCVSFFVCRFGLVSVALGSAAPSSQGESHGNKDPASIATPPSSASSPSASPHATAVAPEAATTGGKSTDISDKDLEQLSGKNKDQKSTSVTSDKVPEKKNDSGPRLWAAKTLVGIGGGRMGVPGASKAVVTDKLGVGVEGERLLTSRWAGSQAVAGFRYFGIGGVHKETDASLQTTLLMAGAGVDFPLSRVWDVQARGWLGLTHCSGIEQLSGNKISSQKWGAVVGASALAQHALRGSLYVGAGPSVYLGSVSWASLDFVVSLKF